MAVNAAEILDEVLEKMRLSSTSPTAVTRAQVLRELNNMQRDLTEHSYLFLKKDDAAIALVSGTRSYVQPTDCFEIIRVFDVDEKKIYPITIDQLEEMSRDWVEETGTPEYFMMNYEAANYLTFYPLPAADDDTDAIGLLYRYYPTAQTDSATSYLTGPIANNKQLAVDWCLGKLLMARTEAQDQAMAQAYLSGYYNERRKWEARPSAPEKLRVFGVRGDQPAATQGPGLPTNYPSLRLWE